MNTMNDIWTVNPHPSSDMLYCILNPSSHTHTHTYIYNTCSSRHALLDLLVQKVSFVTV